MITQLQEEILKLKKEKNIGILAHSYQSTDILEIADLKGDSFALSEKAQDLDFDTVIMCGVRFMADTVKILSPEKKVILAAPDATCPMAEQIDPQRVIDYKKEHPDHTVVAYVNTTTELKAVSDVCVTSSSAQKIVERLDAETILFIPDQNLGSYIREKVPTKKVVLWDGYCPVHHQITEEDVLSCKLAHPGCKVLMHPECPGNALRYADVVGSTADIIRYCENTSEDVIIGTEKSVGDYLSLCYPQRNFYLLSKKLICPDMRITTLTDVYKALIGSGGQVIEIEENLRLAARRAIDQMIRLGK